ncbi:MAG: IS481 family transposase, partial [Hyphomicrobiales bacterium]
MPWKDVRLMSQREEFVGLSMVDGTCFADLCRRFGISRKTGYKWLKRYRSQGRGGLADRSRRPRGSPARTPPAAEQAVVALRLEHPAWGGRKLKRVLEREGLAEAPAPSTITEILRRHEMIDPRESAARGPMRRFEHKRPNALWQMDFKGDFALSAGGRCHPLSILDDHSRFAVCLRACADQRRRPTQAALIDTFRRYGLPDRMLMDNGSCWGAAPLSAWTQFTVWLVRRGVFVSHGRPYHPQTQGKCERFHRSLKAELIGRRAWSDLAQCRAALERWRDDYNLRRPHEALGLDVPASRYAPSPRAYPEVLEAIEYAPGDEVRQARRNGSIKFRGALWAVGRAFAGEPLAVRPTGEDGCFEIY